MILAVPIAAAIKVVLDYTYPTGRPAPRIELPREISPEPAPTPEEILTR
jgi:predicted PurR-regulated permease PerM